MAEKPTYEDLENEIASLKKTVSALETTELWFNSIFNSLEEAVFVLTPDRKLANINDAAVKIFGYSREELRNLSSEILHVDHDHYLAFGRIIQAASDLNEPANFEFEAKRKNGEIFPTEHTVTLLTDKDGKNIGIVSVVRDITHRMREEKALGESEAKLRMVTETIQDVFWISTPGVAQIVYISPVYEKIWRRTASELYRSPHSFLEAIHQKDLEQYLAVIDKFHSKGKAYQCEYRIVPETGSIRWIYERGYPITDEQGNVNLMTGLCTDITERKEMEETLRATNEKLSALINTSPMAIIALDPNGHITSWNFAAETMFGWKEREVLGKFLPFVPKEKISEHEQLRARVLGGEGFIGLEAKLQKRDGSEIHISISTVPLKDANGSINGIMSVSSDITAQKRMEERLSKSERRFRILPKCFLKQSLKLM